MRRSIPGWEDYDATNDGLIISKERYVTYFNNTAKRKERVLSQAKSRDGYKHVLLQKDKIRKNMLVHRLVYMAFHGEIPSGFEINHKDANKSNNRLDNLELVTRSDNLKHAWDNNLRCQNGEKNHRSKIKEKDINLIIDVYKKTKSLVKAAKYLKENHNIHIGRANIHLIASGKAWKHVARV
jgi:hypothetical protein